MEIESLVVIVSIFYLMCHYLAACHVLISTLHVSPWVYLGTLSHGVLADLQVMQAMPQY